MSSSSEHSDSEEETKKVVQTEDGEEIVVDIDKPEPLSKKEKRLLKKGKITEDKKGLKKLSKKAKKLHESTDDLIDTQKESEDEKEEEGAKSKKSEFSVWIGNLSFDTSASDIKRFLVAKTSKFEEESEGSTEESVKINEKDITRIKMPLAPVRGGPANKNRKNRGFAYVDLKSQAQVNTAVALSENCLNDRNLLIKDAKSFEGRPAVVTKSGDGKGAAISKNPPSRILFVGNLAFDTTEESLEEHFQNCGEITKVRMATFEDSGNCKGFAFVDFRDVDGATAALNDKSCRKLAGRFLRMEFGEDRSKRTKQEKFQNRPRTDDASAGAAESQENFSSYQNDNKADGSAPEQSYSERPKRKHDFKNNFQKSNDSNKRLKPGLALATAQRAKTSILPSAGKKITFD